MKYQKGLVKSVFLVLALLPMKGLGQYYNGSNHQKNRIQIKSKWYTVLSDEDISKLDLKRIDCLECFEITKQKDSTMLKYVDLISNLEYKLLLKKENNKSLNLLIDTKDEEIDYLKSKNEDLIIINKNTRKRSFWIMTGGVALAVIAIISN